VPIQYVSQTIKQTTHNIFSVVSKFNQAFNGRNTEQRMTKPLIIFAGYIEVFDCTKRPIAVRTEIRTIRRVTSIDESAISSLNLWTNRTITASKRDLFLKVDEAEAGFCRSFSSSDSATPSLTWRSYSSTPWRCQRGCLDRK